MQQTGTSSSYSSTNPGSCHCLTDAMQKINDAYTHIQSCSPIKRVSLTILAGSAIAVATLPINLTIATITHLCITLAIGVEPYTSISNKAPLYSGTRLTAFSLCLLGPVIEEIVCRGIIQPGVKRVVDFIVTPFCDKATAKKIAVIAAIVFTSLLFGALHSANSSHFLTSLPQQITAVFSGIIMGLEKEFGGGLLESISHHVTNNTITWVLLQAIRNKN